MADVSSPRAVVAGAVLAGRRAIKGVLVEVFDAPADFGARLPLEGRHTLTNEQLSRLGSCITDSSGHFQIEYVATRFRYLRPSARSRNIWLTASSCCQGESRLDFVYQAGEVRERAGQREEYTICLAEDYEDALNPIDTPSNRPTPTRLEQVFAADTAIAQAEKKIASERLKRKKEVDKEFHDKIAPAIIKQLSIVELDKDGNAADPDYVADDEHIRTKAEDRIVAAIKTNLAADLPRTDKLAVTGRVSLTPDQLERLGSVGTIDEANDTVTVDEIQLRSVLSDADGNGANPEDGTQIVNRVNAIAQFCLDRARTDGCLRHLTGNGEVPVDGEEPGVPVVEGPPLGDGQDRGGQTVTVDSLTANLPSYIATVLDEASVLDPGTAVLPSPGQQLSQEVIGSQDTFPSLTLPPGPADVPAYHDFYDLQIAFKPVWTQAIDESVIGNAEAIYERYVENGGEADDFWVLVLRPGTFTASLMLPPPDVSVQKHIAINNEEWSALNAEQQRELKGIAAEIQLSLDFLHRGGHEDRDYENGVDLADLTAFTNAKAYVDAKVTEWKEQGERFVSIARDELERQASSRSLVPANQVIDQLRSRASSAYPAKYFAADKSHRSVNFGLLLTYRQRWTPTAYQVGELIKSIPLAPKEARKYSKRTVKKERRARKEIESNLESMRSETNSTTRAEADIVQKAMEKTNFNASANGSFTVGVWSGGGSSGLSQDAEQNSSETKKSFHEAVVKAAREYKNEIKVELETETTLESEFQESGELVNPNDELTVTYLFYELQRRYRVEERLHRLTSVVLVAQEMPNPADIDEDWLIAHRWILNRVMLDDRLKEPLLYVAEGLVAERFALEEMRKSLLQQRRLVEELKEDVSDSRVLTESRYSALQRSMERTARATQRKSKGGGLFGFVKKLVTPPAIEGIVDSFVGGQGGETPEAARIREAAAQDAYQRELQRLRDLEGQLAQSNASLARITEEYTDRLSAHMSRTVQVTELQNHVKDNITHYMQAIWMHEPFQQRWLRLKDVPVPVLSRPDGTSRTYSIRREGLLGSLANVAHLKTATHEYTAWPELAPPDNANGGRLRTVPLYEVADIDDLMGFRANYMIFPMRKANAITDFMMEPYVEKTAGAFGITDPDDYGNMSLDEFSEYVCCLKAHLTADEFETLKETLKAQLKKLLQSPLRDDEEIVVPMDAAYIEALPGATPILENFKLLHRQIDAADAQEDLRLKKIEKIRYAQRLLLGITDDPEADARYVFHGTDSVIVSPQPSGGTGAGADQDDDNL